MDSRNLLSRTDMPSRGQDARQAQLEQQVQHLLVAIEHTLRAHPAGVSELALIKALQAAPWQLVGDVNFHDPARLYPVHFLIFHTLYRLRDQLAEAGESLTISPLRIRLQATAEPRTDTMPGAPDPLRLFYLDLSQYRLSEDSIRQMMDDFWAGAPRTPPAREETRAAARQLGLDALPEDFALVKQAFRRAVMRAHPDRGGDTETVQRLNQAFSVLKAHFQYSI